MMLRSAGLRLRGVPRRMLSTRATNVLDELETRGFIQATTSPDLRKQLETPTVLYAGIDPSASSLHVGNLLPLLGLLHFRARGHRALALIGGATGMIGDPSGRSTERNALDEDELAVNVAGITAQVERFFNRGTSYAAKRGYEVPAAEREVEVLNNYDWFKGIGFLEFLRDVGKYARVNAMLARDSVKSRLDSESGISFTEFSYQLLQAHDYATLYRSHGCRLQLGGSDQWGNIVAGIDMIQRVRAAEAASAAAASGKKKKQDTAVDSAPQAFGLTIPLLTTSSGEKFGKSMGNAIWLDEARTSVSDFWQFFYRANDADVHKYLSLLTLVPTQRIADVVAAHAADPAKRAAQQLLADEVTELVHGPSAVRRAHMTKDILYGTNPRALKSADVLEAFEGDPRLVRYRRSELQGKPLSKLAALHGLVQSRAEASRLIKSQGSGLSLNENPITDPRQEISATDLIDGHLAVLRRGTRDMVIFYVEQD